MPGPLSSIRVVELGQVAAGPFAASLLADLGADVVKVENPDGGDSMRSWPPLSERNGISFSENFASLNRNKRSIILNLKVTEDLETLKRLCDNADVLIENFRPGVLEKLGLGYNALSERNVGLVYCSISGYGQKGLYAQKGAFDVTVQAISGLMSVTGEDGQPPVKCGVPVGDFCAGLYAAFSIVASLNYRTQIGRGAFIDCSMLGSLLGIAALQTSEYFGTGSVPRRLGSAHPRNAPYQAFRASDVYFVIAAGNDRLWLEVCQCVGLPDLATNPLFRTQTLRAAHQEQLSEILGRVFETQSAAYWLEKMDGRGVPCAPINNFRDILADPHVGSMDLVRPLTLPNGVETKTVTFPVRISGFKFDVRRPPPKLGEHQTEVLSEWLSAPSRERTDRTA
jgi:succinate--hydroxymethylglutarate CoA-transferase